MGRKKGNKNRYNFLIDRETYENFSLICDDLGLIRSRFLEKAMKKFVEEQKELLKELKNEQK